MTNQKSLTKQDLLRNFTLRLASEDQFMASVIKKYQQHERLNSREFRHEFNLSEVQLTRLSLCKRPISETSEFREKVKEIAAYSGVETHFLVSMIRQVDSLDALAQLPSYNFSEQTSTVTQTSPALAAARDRNESKSDRGSKKKFETDDDIK